MGTSSWVIAVLSIKSVGQEPWLTCSSSSLLPHKLENAGPTSTSWNPSFAFRSLNAFFHSSAVFPPGMSFGKTPMRFCGIKVNNVFMTSIRNKVLTPSFLSLSITRSHVAAFSASSLERRSISIVMPSLLFLNPSNNLARERICQWGSQSIGSL